MKKRVLSALLALCMACTLAGNVWAAEETEPTPAPSAGVEVQTVEPQTVEPTPSAEPTQAPAPSPDATAAPEATPEPSAAPDATVEPDVTPAPTEEPEATAAPAATATPDATADPAATPAPTEAPAATATPEPSDEPEATAVPAVAYVAPVQTAEDQQINVHVDVPEGAFAENVAPTLHAQLITGETEEEQAELDKAAAQVAEQTGAAFDGMLALDVYFTDANAEDPEQEIEPALPVSVRLELSENVLPEGYDPATLAVHHLAEEKDAAGEPVTDENGEAAVTVETVANAVTDDAEVPGVVALSDAAAEAAEAPAEVARIADLPAPETAATPADEQAAAEAEQALTDPAVVAEFEVGSFSWFTLTYNEGNGIRVYLVDENGDELWNGEVNFSDLSDTYNPTDFGEKWITGQWVSIEELAGTWAAKTEGYVYQGAYRSNYSGPSDQIRWIRYNVSGENYGWRYSNNPYRPNNYNNGESLSNLYLVYAPVTETTENEQLKIVDSVAADGQLKAQYTGSETETPYFVWEKTAGNGSEWQEIIRLKMNGDEYNLAEDGQWLNAALEVVNDEEDVGGRWFRVSAYESKEAYESNEPALTTSAAMQLNYYDELRNGSFEEPKVEELAPSNSNYQYPNGSEGLIWLTTGRDKQIEIVDASKTNSGNYGGNISAPHDEQFAELNCQAAGALYQDVLTVPGTDLNWQFYHRGRVGTDEMFLVIAPANEVSNITEQDELEDLIEKIQGNQNGYTEEDGYYCFSASDAKNWRKYTSDSQGAQAYHVPDGQYLTRFFFVAGDVAAKDENDNPDYTQGNFIDHVLFTTELLPPEAGSANLTVKKVVTGVEDISNYTVEIAVTAAQGNHGSTQNVGSVTLGEGQYAFTQQSNGSYVAEWTVQVDNISANSGKTVTVTETATPPAGYDSTGSTVKVNNGTEENAAETEVALYEQTNNTVTFTNNYAAKEPLVPGHRKYIKANTDGTYDLTLDVTGIVQEPEQGEVPKFDILYILDKSNSMVWYDMSGGWASTKADMRLTKAKEAISAFEESLKGVAYNEDNEAVIDVQHSLVAFWARANVPNGCDWKALNQPLSMPNDGDSSTNYDAALREAANQLKNARDDASKVVVFVSDGEPNSGDGQDYVDDLNLGSEDYFFAIGVSDDVTYNSLNSLLNKATEVPAEHKKCVVCTSSDDLVNAFEGLTEELVGVDCSNVTITDTLSDYAKLTDDAKFTVTINRGSGTAALTQEAQLSAASTGNGENLTFNLGQGNTLTLNVKYVAGVENTDNPNGQFILTFPDNTPLENGWTYSITTQIEPTDEAYETYEANLKKTGNDGYDGVKGDLNTDADGYETSSEKPGFHSNNSATLTYVSNGVDATENYDHPVIQVKLASFKITKVVKDDVNTNNQEFTFKVYKEGNDGRKTEVKEVKAKAGVTVTVSDLLPGTYSVEEVTTNMPEGQKDGKQYYFASVAYTVKGSEGSSVVLEPGDKDDTVTVTNTYEPYKTVTIIKDVQGEMGNTKMPFDFTTSIARGTQSATAINEAYKNATNKTWEVELNANSSLEQDSRAKWTTSGYTLADGESLVITKVKKGDTFAVTETTNDLGYETTYAATGATNSAGGFVVGDSDVTLTVTNKRGVVTPTGLESNHTKPYALMVGAGALAGLALVGGILARRARRRREW